MLRISKEAKVGLTVLIGFLILIIGVNFLKGKGVFAGGQKFYGLYTRVDGLTDASPIFYKGFKIGAVQSVSFSEDNKNILVGMSLYADILFPKNTIAQIYSLDLMGTKGIRLVYGDDSEMLEPGDTLQTALVGDLADKVSQEVLPLKNKAENLVVKIDSLLTNINSLFDEQSKASITNGIKSFSVTMKNMEGMSASINQSLTDEGSLGRSLANVDSLTGILKQNGDLLTGVMKNLDSVTSQLEDAQIDSVAHEMNRMLSGFNSVLSDLNEGNGSLGKLLKDEQLYYNLNEVSVSLDRLLNDVRHNPSRYVRFSAVSFGEGKSTESQVEDVVYKIQIDKTKEPLDIRGTQVLDSYTISEDRYDKYYIYTVGEEKDYDKIQGLQQEIKGQYPNSTIIALKGGKSIKVSKTLK